MTALRLSIRPGDVLLFEGDTLTDDVIRLGTRSTWNHVAVVTDQPRVMVEALPGGVRLAPIPTKGPYWVVVAQALWGPATSAFCRAVVGEPYSYLNDLVAGLGLAPLTTQAWECAQLAAQILRTMGWTVPSDCDTPQKVAMLLAARGCLFQYQDF